MSDICGEELVVCWPDHDRDSYGKTTMVCSLPTGHGGKHRGQFAW